MALITAPGKILQFFPIRALIPGICLLVDRPRLILRPYAEKVRPQARAQSIETAQGRQVQSAMFSQKIFKHIYEIG